MQGNFLYSNPVRLHFGENAIDALAGELAKFGPKVLLTYGGGSIKKNGVYEDVLAALKKAGKVVVELPGVMPNPTVAKLNEGCKLAKAEAVDLILAVGGGSTCDYAKALSVSAYCEEDPWTKYYLHMEDVDNKIIPVGCVLTMAGTGSEMNAGSVITNPEQKLKIGHVFDDRVMPKFTILNPRYTMSLPVYQMKAGIFDIMSHIMEQYFSGTDDNTSDYLAEGLMKSLIHSSRIAVKDPQDYEARSNIMWTATWALNTLIGCGKSQDWEVHMIGQAVGGVTNATHGMTLSAVSLPYYRLIKEAGLAKFARFAVNVWGINPEGKSQEELADAGLNALEGWMKEIGVYLHLSELGCTEGMFDDIIKGTFLLQGGYKVLTAEDVRTILTEAM
ncbi:iron-containing alcohol dehydrogenase [Acidaminococcus sp. NSJ-142]|jgi:alcohol dehydrogenase YqhD (iron-dependent ADH family)|uniref:iron-containing alcohol dehydrogenase n=1 Tax=Acidaminococcus TaxID=904 RepID=UPI001E33F55C|nr:MULTISPECIES: iron-containing alcohol dehydrogenase [Acidaminococcus]MCD2436434.1 iron-containing alcohol dehydrogenase [Acidaminococcus hominis]MCH4095066.1 iron-containing alcohol dehydrogenase [Acidaminococcus provencensis]